MLAQRKRSWRNSRSFSQSEAAGGDKHRPYMTEAGSGVPALPIALQVLDQLRGAVGHRDAW